MLGEGINETGSEEIPVRNVYLMKNTTSVDDINFTDTEFALKFNDNNDYYKVKN